MAHEDALRSDAQANRDRILAVARDALAAEPHASLNSIAKQAEVGAGTLYRHFPSRESLVLAVYRKEIETLVTLAPALLVRHSPLQALRTWCSRLAQFGRMKYGVADIVHAAASEQDAQRSYAPMLGAVRQLMDACKAVGAIDADAAPDDFLLLVGLLWRIPPTAAGEAQVQRILAIAIRGLGAKDSPPETPSWE